MDDRQLIEDLLSALEYHTEQTRPIEFSKVAIEAAREYLRKPAQRTWVGLEKSDMPDGADPLFDDPKFIAGMVYAANKLMEKNT